MTENAKLVLGLSGGLLVGYWIGLRSRPAVHEVPILMDEAKHESVPPLSTQKHDLSWRGSWDRPMTVDEGSIDRLTTARMTDHNVRGGANVAKRRNTQEHQR